MTDKEREERWTKAANEAMDAARPVGVDLMRLSDEEHAELRAEVSALKHARDCSDIRRFGECYLPFDSDGKHLPSEHQAKHLMTSGAFQFVECSCSESNYPTVHVWVREHYAGPGADGWAELEGLLKQQGGHAIPLHRAVLDKHAGEQ